MLNALNVNVSMAEESLIEIVASCTALLKCCMAESGRNVSAAYAGETGQGSTRSVLKSTVTISSKRANPTNPSSFFIKAVVLFKCKRSTGNIKKLPGMPGTTENKSISYIFCPKFFLPGNPGLLYRGFICRQLIIMVS